MTLKVIKKTKHNGRTDNVKTVYPPTNTVCGGYKKTVDQWSCNAHRISGPKQHLDKMAEKTLTLITNNPQLTHSVYNINLIPGHRMQ